MRTDLKSRIIETAARDWWTSLQPSKLEDGRQLPGDRATLARLRRAGPLEAASEPATMRLFHALSPLWEAPTPEAQAAALGRIATMASLLAHVRDDDTKPLGRALGPPRGAKLDEAILKPLRLARLLGARGDEEIATQLRRAVAMLGGKANVGNLAWLALMWDQGQRGDRVRTLFAFAYHDATDHAPPETAGDTADATPPTATA